MRLPDKKSFLRLGLPLVSFSWLLGKLRAQASRLLLGLPFLLFVILLAVIAQQEYAYRETVFPRVFLNHQSYARTSQADARQMLEASIAETYRGGMIFVYEDKTFTASLEELGLDIDPAASVEQIFSYGHRANLLASAREQLALLGGNVYFPSRLRDQGFVLTDTKRAELAKLENPARDFSYAWNGKSFTPVAAAAGYVLDEEKLAADIRRNLLSLSNDPIQLVLRADQPAIESDLDGCARQAAEALSARQIILAYDGKTWPVPAEDFRRWIGFTSQEAGGRQVLTLAPNRTKLDAYLAALKPDIDREPVNAELQLTAGKVGVFALSKDGLALDTATSAERLTAALFRPENYVPLAAAADGTLTVELAVNRVSPALTTDSIDNLGLTALLATGSSNFHGSTQSRRHNVATGASKFNGVLIAPGATFSFNRTLGDVGPDTGYLPELVIKQGQTLAEYGGGLCQVSTTAFRAAVNAGLEITKRSNHAYAVKYYAPQGTDATIYPPDPDLQFINNTPASILIQTRISGDNLYFDFYGTSDGRKVVLEGPVVYERSAGGAMKTWWKQTVFNADGSQLLTKTFYSNYKSADLYPLASSTKKPAPSTPTPTPAPTPAPATTPAPSAPVASASADTPANSTN